jgi:hypothetical protein
MTSIKPLEYSARLDDYTIIERVNRTPAWADFDTIEYLYNYCQDEPECRIEYIYGLYDEDVSGLNVHQNMVVFKGDELIIWGADVELPGYPCDFLVHRNFPGVLLSEDVEGEEAGLIFGIIVLLLAVLAYSIWSTS